MLEERNLSAVRAGNREIVQDAVNWITQQHGDALAHWVEEVWFDGVDAVQRKGISTADPAIKHIHDTNLLEYLISEGVFETTPGDKKKSKQQKVFKLLLDASLDLTGEQSDYLKQLGKNPLRLYRVIDCVPGESFSLQVCRADGESTAKDKPVLIEDKWISRMLDVGDTVGLRLMQTGGVWETSGAVYHIPNEYVSDLQARLDAADAENYSSTLILFWLELVAAHV
jgi:hypothetical protein